MFYSTDPAIVRQLEAAARFNEEYFGYHGAPEFTETDTAAEKKLGISGPEYFADWPQ